MSDMRNIVVVSYDPMWSERFEKEAKAIKAILGDLLLEIHHIGSTSVPGLAAKPVIDILPVVRDITLVDAFNPPFEAIGYEPMGENGIPGRRFFRKGGAEHRSHHLHIFGTDNTTDIHRHLAFRDYLRTHPEVADEYASLKQTLARKFPHDINAYCDGKDAFIKHHEAIALGLYRSKKALL